MGILAILKCDRCGIRKSTYVGTRETIRDVMDYCCWNTVNVYEEETVLCDKCDEHFADEVSPLLDEIFKDFLGNEGRETVYHLETKACNIEPPPCEGSCTQCEDPRCCKEKPKAYHEYIYWPNGCKWM